MERKSIKKRIISLLLCVILIIGAVGIYFACESGKIKDLEPYRAEFQRLIEQSFEVNEILFGEGLPVYDREECLGELYYTSEKNEEYISYFRAGQGKDFPEQLYTDRGTMFRLYYWIYRDPDLTKKLGEEIYICKYSMTYYVPDGTDENGNPEYDMVTEICYALRRDALDAVIPEEMKNGGIVYRDQEGKVMSTLSVSSDILYETPEEMYYYLLNGYEEPSFEYEYDENDNEYYDVVRFDSEYLTIDAIKELAERVYSTDYLSDMYSSLFDGIRTDFSDSSSSVLLARYIEEASGDEGMVYLRKSNLYEARFTEQRTYDYSTMEIAQPYSKDRVNVTVTANGSYYSSEARDVVNGPHTVKLSFVLENGTWKLDSPTY